MRIGEHEQVIATDSNEKMNSIDRDTSEQVTNVVEQVSCFTIDMARCPGQISLKMRMNEQEK